MALVEWTAALSVGVSAIDAQHRKLVDIINELHEARRTGKGKTIIDRVIGELQRYTVEHFAYEEQLLRTTAYPQLKEQVDEHKAFVSQLADFRKKMAANAPIATDVMNFTRDWLVNHIMKSDKKYCAHFVAKGIK